MAQTFNNGESNLSVRTKLNDNATELNSTTSALAGKATPADIETAIDTVRGGYNGSLQDLYDLIMSGLLPAAAPTGFIVDNGAKTADFTYASGFILPGDYEYQINGGTITTATAKPIDVPNENIAIGQFKIRTKAVPGVNAASNWLTNPTAYTETTVGRIINVTLPPDLADEISIDGTNLIYEGLPTTIQNGDTVLIAGATIIGDLWFKNFSLPDGQMCYVKNDGQIISNGESVFWDGNQKNVTYDFSSDGVNEYGLVPNIQSGWSFGRCHLDYSDIGEWKNVTISGIYFNMDVDGAALFMGGAAGQPWNNGTGKIESRGLILENIKVDINATITKPLIFVYGEIWNNGVEIEDSNYHEDLTVRNIIVNGNGFDVIQRVIKLKNIEGYKVHDIEFSNINPTATTHERLIELGGTGDVYNVKANNYYGNIFQLSPYKRLTSTKQVRYWNIMGTNNSKYSVVELQLFSEQLSTGVIEETHSRGDFITGYKIATSEEFVGTCVDIFNCFDCSVFNSVTIEGYNNAGHISNPELPASAASCRVYNDNTLSLLNTTTFVPASGSSLKEEASEPAPHVLTDIYGTTRPLLPTIGAVEAL